MSTTTNLFYTCTRWKKLILFHVSILLSRINDNLLSLFFLIKKQIKIIILLFVLKKQINDTVVWIDIIHSIDCLLYFNMCPIYNFISIISMS